MEKEELRSQTKYHKIYTIFDRDSKFKLIKGVINPKLIGIENIKEFVVTEKIDGCLHYGNTVLTDKGLIPIGRLVEKIQYDKKQKINVLSYNIQTKKTEFKPIINYHKEKRLRPFLNIWIKSKNNKQPIKHITCTDNHKFYIKNKWIEAKKLKKGMKINHLLDKLSLETKQIILGGLLGDSSIYSTSIKNYGFSFIHSIKQSDYFDYKLKLLQGIINEGKGYKGGFKGSLPNRRANSIINLSISDLIKEYCLVNGKKRINPKWINELTPLSIAIWYMDDGSAHFSDKQRARIHFATNGFSFKEVALLKNMFKIKYDIESKVFDYKGATLILTADGSEKLFSLIYPYICKGMWYKLPKKYRMNSNVLNKLKSLSKNSELFGVKIMNISNKLPIKYKFQQDFQYDLTIKDNSNYFTNGVLVHNTNCGLILTPEKEILVRKRSDFIEDDKEHHVYFEAIKDIDMQKIKDYFEGSKSLVTIFGEVCGGNIQKQGKTYSEKPTFKLFDVKCGNSFFDWNDVIKFSKSTGIEMVKWFKFEGKDILDYNYWLNLLKEVNKKKYVEGYVVRSRPALLSKFGLRMCFKIKLKDF